VRASHFVGVSWTVAVVVFGAGVARAQSDSAPATPMEIAVSCGSPAMDEGSKTDHALHVIGAQDTVRRTLFDDRDLLVIDGGTAGGVQLGQEYYVRGQSRLAPMRYSGAPIKPFIRTAAWIRIVATNTNTSIAQVVHACGEIFQGDYLEPYKAPAIPAGADRDEATGTPDFNALGHIISGPHDRKTAALGDFVLIDRGSEQGVTAGARFAVYRDLAATGMPLASIGEVVVVEVGKNQSLTRITRSRDALQSGDYVAPRK
jgi:hypothetical protein